MVMTSAAAPGAGAHAHAHAHAVTTFEPDIKYRLLLRVDAATDLAHKSSQGAYCKVMVGDACVLDGSQKKLTKSASSESNGASDGLSNRGSSTNQDEAELYSTFRTQTRTAAAPLPTAATDKSKSVSTTAATTTTWDETFEVRLRDPSTDVLNLRVKSQHRFFCPVIGTIAIYLRHLRVGHQADQWFPLRRGKKDVGRIRLHLLVTPESSRKKTRNGSDLAADIKVALAANFAADDAIQRLVDKQLKSEEARQQRRLRGETSDDDDEGANKDGSNRARGGANRNASAKASGSNRSEARFAVLLPAATDTSAAAAVAASAATSAVQTETFTRLNQVDALASASNTRRGAGALGSGRSAARFVQPTPTGNSNNNNNSNGLTSPLRSNNKADWQQSHVQTNCVGTNASTATTAPMIEPTPSVTSTGRMLTDAERNHRRAENFARLQDFDDADASSLAVAALALAAGSKGSDRGSSRHSPTVSKNRPSSARSGNGYRELLYSIPSFGPDDDMIQHVHNRGKRHSAASSSTDSDSHASIAEYERRIDRKLRKVRKATEKLQKLKRQLRKYIPDLTDSDSDSDSDGSAASAPSSPVNLPNSVNNKHKMSAATSATSSPRTLLQQQQTQQYYC